jgi:hypothetical protein
MHQDIGELHPESLRDGLDPARQRVGQIDLHGHAHGGFLRVGRGRIKAEKLGPPDFRVGPKIDRME